MQISHFIFDNNLFQIFNKKGALDFIEDDAFLKVIKEALELYRFI